ncbi:MAG: FAD binding domain-containing protein [Acidobacteriota bacterium]
MLRLPPFEYRRPATLEEATQMMAEGGGRAMLVAGGTDLLPNLKRRQFEPAVLVSLQGLGELRAIDADGAGLLLGSGVTLYQLGRSEAVRSRFPALAQAASQIANPQIQRMGTLGGNLCVDTRCNYYNQTHEWRKSIGFCMKKDGAVCLVAPGSRKCWAISSSDTAPVLISLGAEVVLAGVAGERTIPVEALYQDDGINYLTRQPNEILIRIVVPAAAGLRCSYRKVRRRGSFDFPILGVATALEIEDGRARRAKIVLGAVHTHPVEVVEAERLMVGETLSPELIEAAAEAAAAAATPLDNADLTLYWRKKMARVEVRRALLDLVDLQP